MYIENGVVIDTKIMTLEQRKLLSQNLIKQYLKLNTRLVDLLKTARELNIEDLIDWDLLQKPKEQLIDIFFNSITNEDMQNLLNEAHEFLSEVILVPFGARMVSRLIKEGEEALASQDQFNIKKVYFKLYKLIYN